LWASNAAFLACTHLFKVSGTVAPHQPLDSTQVHGFLC
jgi:hypothetical protein